MIFHAIYLKPYIMGYTCLKIQANWFNSLTKAELLLIGRTSGHKSERVCVFKTVGLRDLRNHGWIHAGASGLVSPLGLIQMCSCVCVSSDPGITCTASSTPTRWASTKTTRARRRASRTTARSPSAWRTPPARWPSTTRRRSTSSSSGEQIQIQLQWLSAV